ncbi:MAG: hypothetical protein QME12_06570 [Nanoarchaeota archaeon]|nr:hypothetical protein [Nanoarchaeota archaeon]
MKDAMRENVYEADISNQIENPWNKETILAVISRDKSFRFTIKVNGEYKISIRDEFCHSLPAGKENYHKFHRERNANSIVITIIHAYLIHKITVLNPNMSGALIVCPDARPKEKVEKYFYRACRHFCSGAEKRIRITFRKSCKIGGILVRTPRSMANQAARKTLRKKINPNYSITKEDIRELKGFIRSNYQKMRFN